MDDIFYREVGLIIKWPNVQEYFHNTIKIARLEEYRAFSDLKLNWATSKNFYFPLLHMPKQITDRTLPILLVELFLTLGSAPIPVLQENKQLTCV